MSILCLKTSTPPPPPSHFVHFENWLPKINPFQKLYPPPPRDEINDRSPSFISFLSLLGLPPSFLAASLLAPQRALDLRDSKEE